MKKKESFKHPSLFLITILAVSLHQAGYILGFNMSIADILIPLLLIYLVMQKNFVIPINSIIFFSILITITTFTTFFITPYMFKVIPNFINYAKELIKLIVSLLYLLIGYNMFLNRSMFHKFIKTYSWVGVIIGTIGIIFTIFNVAIFRDYLFFAGIRFDGLMEDPNYYSILILTSVPYFIENQNISVSIKATVISVIFISILISGSKTGTIVFIVFLLFRTTYTYLFNKLNLKKVMFLIILVLLIPFMLSVLVNSLEYLSTTIPIINRVLTVFVDFENALSDGGSSRSSVYLTSLEIIKRSPLVGIGVGTYSDIATIISGKGAIAHNTYLQLISEWGLIMSLAIFGYLFNLLYLINKKQNNKNENRILLFVMLILLLGSLAISLNNARIFWIVYGAIIASGSRKLKNSNADLRC